MRLPLVAAPRLAPLIVCTSAFLPKAATGDSDEDQQH